ADGGIAEMIGCYHFLSEVKGITAHAVGKLNLSNLNSFMFYVNNEKAVPLFQQASKGSLELSLTCGHSPLSQGQDQQNLVDT
ncbi:MAG: hypothetical protein NW237_11970, partial [Cyanobacteriota bacterium]|nr:hypothetical protein [Cyanobacteriota bacterium]